MGPGNQVTGRIVVPGVGREVVGECSGVRSGVVVGIVEWRLSK